MYDRRSVLRGICAGTIGASAIGTLSSTAAAATVITVKGAGYNIWYDNDAFHYYYQSVSGDFDVTAHNMFVEDTHGAAFGGIMVRESLDASSKNLVLRRMPSGDAGAQWRSEDGGGTSGQPSSTFMTADWLRLKREGDTITLYGSQGEPTSDSDWSVINTFGTETIELSDDVYVGLAVTSHDPDLVCTTKWKDLRGDFSMSEMTSSDIGDPKLSGSVSVEEGVPLVTTGEATDVRSASATLNGSLDDLGEADSAEVSFEYREMGADSWNETSAETLTSTGSVSQEVSDLSISLQDYEFRVVADTSDGDTATGRTREFDTSSIASVESVTNVDVDSATFSGSIDLDDPSSVEAHFEYRKVPTASWVSTDPQTPSDDGSLSADISGLTSRRCYEVRLVGEADDETAFSSVTVFSTPNRSNAKSSGSGPESKSHFEPGDGFAEAAPWLDDQTPIVKITEPTRGMLERSDVPSERLVVFETSGTIDLDGDLSIRNDKMYLAGQTAPSPGITLIRGGFYIDCDDSVVQHIRCRAGDAGKTTNDWQPDSLHTGDDTKNNVIDHCTATWGVDETLSVGYRSDDTTVSNCLVAEALYNPIMLNETRGKGSLIGNDAKNVALLGNIWTQCSGRNPRLKTGTESAMINNVVHHFGEAANLDDDTVASVVGNAFLDTTQPADPAIDGGSAYLDDNYADPEITPLTDVLDEFASAPLWPEGLEAMDSEAALEHNIAHVGARPADRTAHDERVIEQIKDGTERWIDSQEEVGGYPDLSENTHKLNVPNGGTRSWLASWARRVETPAP